MKAGIGPRSLYLGCIIIIIIIEHWPLVPSSPGGVMEHWLKDEAVDNCMKCSAEFTFTERKHHCRDCGRIFCAR